MVAIAQLSDTVLDESWRCVFVKHTRGGSLVYHVRRSRCSAWALAVQPIGVVLAYRNTSDMPMSAPGLTRWVTSAATLHYASLQEATWSHVRLLFLRNLRHLQQDCKWLVSPHLYTLSYMPLGVKEWPRAIKGLDIGREFFMMTKSGREGGNLEFGGIITSCQLAGKRKRNGQTRAADFEDWRRRLPFLSSQKT